MPILIHIPILPHCIQERKKNTGSIHPLGPQSTEVGFSEAKLAEEDEPLESPEPEEPPGARGFLRQRSKS